MSFPHKPTQFQKGRSGNPSGRPKGSRNLATVLYEKCKEQYFLTPWALPPIEFCRQYFQEKKLKRVSRRTVEKVFRIFNEADELEDLTREIDDLLDSLD